MKRIFLVLVFCWLFVLPAKAQGPIYLPIILKSDIAMITNNWQIVSPVGSNNYVLNPSAETTGNFAAVGGATVTRSTAFQKYGLYSYLVQPAAISDGIRLTLSALTNTEHFVTFRVRGNKQLQLTIGSTTKDAKFIEKIDDNWDLYGAPFAAAQVNGQTALDITAKVAADYYVDGVQVEPLGYYTTYIDGTQKGCEWLGSAHASISQRSSQSRAGGEPRDFYDDYGFFVEKVVGAGASSVDLGIDSYSILPGGELNSIKIQSRQFTIVGTFFGDTEAELQDNKQLLLSVLSNNTYPGNQPIPIRYNGAKVQKEIEVHYQGGLESDLSAFYGNSEPTRDSWNKLYKFTERATIQLSAPNPFWKEVGESAITLDVEDSATFYTVAARLRATGQWDNLGPPNALGTYDNVYAIAEDGTYIYFIGDFTNFDNIANADSVVRYNKQTGAYSALGTGVTISAANDAFSAIIGPDGSLYIGGDFTQVGGVANTAYIARWDGSAWNALGTGMNGLVNDMAFGPDGTLYAVGSFTTAGGGAANRIAAWDGSAWSTLGSGLDNTANAVVVTGNNILYVGGSFANAGGSAAAQIASWNGSSWSALSTGTDSTGSVAALALGKDDTLFMGGNFTTAGGVTVNRIAQWNGTAWSALGSGMNASVETLDIGPDGTLYASGSFTTAGGLTITNKSARWNGSVWSHLDIQLQSGAVVHTFHVGAIDPVVSQNYNIWLGYGSGSGVGKFAGLVTPNNEGTAIAFPTIVYTRSGGTSATIATLRNERTGQEILFDYDLLDGETLTITLEPTKKNIVSSLFGQRLDAYLAGSDFGTWALLPGENDITSFVINTGSTITAYMQWREAYLGYN